MTNTRAILIGLMVVFVLIAWKLVVGALMVAGVFALLMGFCALFTGLVALIY